VVAAPIVEGGIMAGAEGLTGGVTIMAGEAIIVEAALIGEVTGEAVSGLAQDGAGDGADGARGGGAPRSILTIHPLLLSSSSLPYTLIPFPRKRKWRVTGITAGIPRAIIRM
jgi:hypothetical protein